MTHFYWNRLKNNESQENGRPHGGSGRPFFRLFYFSYDFNRNWSSHRKWPQNSKSTIDFEIGQKLRPTAAITGFCGIISRLQWFLTSTLSHSNFWLMRVTWTCLSLKLKFNQLSNETLNVEIGPFVQQFQRQMACYSFFCAPCTLRESGLTSLEMSSGQ